MEQRIESNAARSPGRWRSRRLEPRDEAALRAWQVADRRGVVVVAPGDDTRLAIAALARENRSALCLVPSRVRLERWCRDLQEACAERVGCYGNGVKRLRKVTVSTYASAASFMARFGDRFEMVIAGDVHVLGGGTHAAAFDHCSARAIMGLTTKLPEDPAEIAKLRQLIGPVVRQRRAPLLASPEAVPYSGP